MKYILYKMKFNTSVHIGQKSLSDSSYSVCSDTFFSALCSEAARRGQEYLDELVDKARESHIKISDMFPYIEEKYMLPKPYITVDRKQESDSSVIRKAYKALKFVPMDDFDDYLKGDFDVQSAVSMSKLGVPSLKISASVRNGEGETKPYEVGVFTFNPDCGLYFILGFEDETSENLVSMLMEQLSLSGIGGKRSSGYGRFSYEKKDPTPWLIDKLEETGTTLMTLNTSIPQDQEIESVLGGSHYSLIKRCGFVASGSYADSWQRKKDIIMFKAGSCFNNTYLGDVYDVSTNAGRHPVYRYGKPFFMRVSL